MSEEWRPVVGYQGYMVSSEGRVRSFRKSKVDGRLMKQTPDSDGYPSVGLYSTPTIRITTKVATIVALAFLGPRPEGMVVRHLDGDKSNSNVSNLCYGTISENILDQVVHGTHGNSSKVACVNGHPFDEKNTHIKRRGTRDCRACNRERAKSNRLISKAS